MAKKSKDPENGKHVPNPEEVPKTLGVEWQTRAPKEPPMDYVPIGENVKDDHSKM